MPLLRGLCPLFFLLSSTPSNSSWNANGSLWICSCCPIFFSSGLSRTCFTATIINNHTRQRFGWEEAAAGCLWQQRGVRGARCGMQGPGPRGRSKWKGEKGFGAWGLDQCKQHKSWLGHLPPAGSSTARELRAGSGASFLTWCGASLRAKAWPAQIH